MLVVRAVNLAQRIYERTRNRPRPGQLVIFKGRVWRVEEIIGWRAVLTRRAGGRGLLRVETGLTTIRERVT